jgi:hypothetical protein
LTIGVLGFDSRWRLGIFLFTTASRTALGPTHLPIQWVPGSLSPWVKRLGRETDHSPPSSAEVKEWVELYLSSPNTPSRHGVQFKKAQKQLYFYLCLAAVLVSSPPRPDLNFKQILEIHSLIWPPPLKFSSDVPVRAFENFLRLSKARGLAEASDPSKYYDTERNVNFLRMEQNGRPLKTPSVHTFISRGAWFWFLFKFSSTF